MNEMTVASENTFLKGLSDITTTLVRDAAGIAKMRADSERKLAQSKIEMMHTNFMLRVQRNEISPENFEDAFSEYQMGLDEFVDTMPYAPARAMVKADVASSLPRLKLSLGTAMNQANLQKIQDITEETFDNIGKTESSTAEQIYTEQLEVLKNPLINPVVKQRLAQRAQKNFEINGLYEKAKKSLPAEREKIIDQLANPNSDLSKGKSSDARAATMQRLQKEWDFNGDRMIEQVSTVLKAKGNDFIENKEELIKAINETETTSSRKQQAISVIEAQNDQALFNIYEKRITEAKSIDDLVSLLREIEGEGDMPGIERYEYWKDSGKRLQIKDKIETEMAKFKKADDAGISQDAKNDLKGKMNQVYLNFKAGTVPYFTAVEMIRGYNVKAGGSLTEDSTSLEKQMESFVPVNGMDSFESIKDVIQGSKKTKALPKDQVASMTKDVESRMKMFFKKNPNAGKAVYDEWMKNEINLWLGAEMEAVRELEYSDDVLSKSWDAKMISVGAQLNAGKFDQAVDISATGQRSVSGAVSDQVQQNVEWQKKRALEEYGLSNLAEQIDEKGRVSFKDDKGNSYAFEFGGKTPKLKKTSRGYKNEIETDTLESASDRREKEKNEKMKRENIQNAKASLKSTRTDQERKMIIDLLLKMGVKEADILASGYSLNGKVRKL